MAKARTAVEVSGAEIEWGFDLQRSVDLIMGDAGQQFPFERSINTFLLLVWCAVPRHQPTINVTASALALLVTCSDVVSTSKPGLSSGKSVLLLRSKRTKSLAALRARFQEPWFERFYNNFAEPNGGLRLSLGAASMLSLDSSRRATLKECKRELAIVEFLAKSLRYNSNMANWTGYSVAFENDVLCKGREFYRNIGSKQKANANDAARAPHKGLKPSRIASLWGESTDTLVLLFVMRNVLDAKKQRLFSEPGFLPRLQNDKKLRKELQLCLRRYETIMQGLESGAREAKPIRRWRIIKVSRTAPMNSLPQFTAAQLEQVRLHYPKISSVAKKTRKK
jgi:hypothetical protein